MVTQSTVTENRRRPNAVTHSDERIPMCHVQVQSILGGAQRVMLDILSALDRERYEPHVVCHEAGPLTDELEKLQIAYTLFPSLDRPIRPWKDLRAYQQLLAFFRQQQFQIVHTHSSKPGIVARVAARNAGVPHVIHHVHSFAFHEFTPRPLRFFYSQLEKWAGQYCDRVIFVNNEERKMSVRNGWLPESKCVSIYNGTYLDLFHPRHSQDYRISFRKEQDIPEDEVVILTLGRLETPKQPLIFPEIAAELERLKPQGNWRIVVAGDGSYDVSLRAKIKAMSMEHRFQLVGWQQNSCECLPAADIILQPSLWEGLPVSLVEAHAAGIPTVASDVKGNREAVTPETGFLCVPRDASDYAARLCSLIDAPARRNEMGRAARIRAESHFDNERNMARIVNLYDEMLNVERTRRVAA